MLKKLARSNVSNTPQKKRQGVGASYSVLLCFLHPAKLVSGRYKKKDNHDALIGIIITSREVIRVTIREQLFVFTQHEYFEYHELYCIQMWVVVNTEGYDAYFSKDSEEKDEEG